MEMLRFIQFSAGIVLIFIIATIVVINVLAKPYIYNDISTAPETGAIIIPGAATLINGGLSPIFKDRVDAAIRLYRAKKARKVLVSGDNSTVSHNEVDPVRKYLLLAGVPDQDIFLDHAGFDTYSTMYRARYIFGATSTIIATQSFHLPRAVFLARNLGIDAYGSNSDNGSSSWTNYVRETFASEKAVLDLLIDRKPKFLGPLIPLTGDGRTNP